MATVTPTVWHPSGSSSFGSAFAVGDFDGNGYDDLVVADPGASKVYEYVGVTNGPNTSTPSVTISGSTSVNPAKFGMNLAVANIRQTSYPSLLIWMSGASGQNGAVYIYHAAFGLSSTVSVTLSGSTPGFGSFVAAGDFNNDLYADVAVADPSAQRVYFYPGNSSFSVPPTSTTISMPSGNTAFGTSVAAGDINGDGFADLVVGGADSSSLTIGFVYRGASSYPPASPDEVLSGYPVANGAGNYLSMQDLNGDGYCDLVLGDYSYSGGTGRIEIYTDGSSTSTTLTAPSSSEQFGYSVAP
jgi:hypothetical protein